MSCLMGGVYLRSVSCFLRWCSSFLLYITLWAHFDMLKGQCLISKCALVEIHCSSLNGVDSLSVAAFLIIHIHDVM